jgi:DNA-binding transcriptional MerR regulator
MNTRYRIGEFAELGGVSVKTLRFYDEVGVLAPAEVDPLTRYRRYLPEQLEQLASIVALKELGVTLAEIRGLMKKAAPDGERREIFAQVKRKLERSIVRATQSLKWIEAAIKEESEPVGAIPVMVKRRPAMPIASVRAKIARYEEVEELERALLEAVPAQMIEGPRGVLWHRCADSGCLEAEPFVALKHRVRGSRCCEWKELPAATLACAYSRDDGNYDRAYEAIRRWMRSRGYQLAGAKRELYLGTMLEVQFPMASAS